MKEIRGLSREKRELESLQKLEPRQRKQKVCSKHVKKSLLQVSTPFPCSSHLTSCKSKPVKEMEITNQINSNCLEKLTTNFKVNFVALPLSTPI